jgi:HEPN superfamily AbiU2-like protein
VQPGEGVNLQNRRPELLFDNRPILAEIKKRVVLDIEQLNRVVEILRPVTEKCGVQDSFTDTHSGMAFAVIRGSLAREAAAIISRLYAKPRYSNKSINIADSDRSLLLLASMFEDDGKIPSLVLRNTFRFAASGSYSVIENGVARAQTIVETLRTRIQSGRDARAQKQSRLELAIQHIKAFSESPEYIQIRVFRTENIAHSIPVSKDRRKLGREATIVDLTIKQVLDIASKAINLAEDSVLAMFSHSLSLDDQREHWKAYSRLFWSRASGIELPNSFSLDDEG